MFAGNAAASDHVAQAGVFEGRVEAGANSVGVFHDQYLRQHVLCLSERKVAYHPFNTRQAGGAHAKAVDAHTHQ